MRRNSFFLLASIVFFFSCEAQTSSSNKKLQKVLNVSDSVSNALEKGENINPDKKKIETAVIGGGCFWCTEAQYLALEGVETVVSGYAGGGVINPTYKQVSAGNTGHAEVIKIEYDASKISFSEILQAFFITHDPTQLNRQGNDVGTQYRSTIMPMNADQKRIAEEIIKELNAQKVYKTAVVTTIEPLDKFYEAEDYHQNYYAQNSNQPYCQMVVSPKLEKFKKVFKDKLKH